MAAGNGGHRPAVADALIGVLRDDALPELRDLGGLGTGDITVLAQLGLALADSGRLEIEPGDALPLMSSNAATFAVGVARVGRHRASCSTPGSASRRSRSTRWRATRRRSPPRSPRPGRCAG